MRTSWLFRLKSLITVWSEKRAINHHRLRCNPYFLPNIAINLREIKLFASPNENSGLILSIFGNVFIEQGVVARHLILSLSKAYFEWHLNRFPCTKARYLHDIFKGWSTLIDQFLGKHQLTWLFLFFYYKLQLMELSL